MTNFKSKVYEQQKSLKKDEQEKLVKTWLKNCPPWRRQEKVNYCDRDFDKKMRNADRGKNFVLDPRNMSEEKINFALLLRRPLLVEGHPGIGKTSLAYHLAWYLGLGEPLRWEINSRTTLADGLYSYDAVEHLRHSSKEDQLGQSPNKKSKNNSENDNIGEFITLGPLGTALLPTEFSRVLIIDELDKANYDLPNDLLHVFEEGAFKIPELVRSGDQQKVVPFDAKNTSDRVTINHGEVRTKHYPIVVITSNGEREFSPAFLRRCVRLVLDYPTSEQLSKLVCQHLGIKADKKLIDLCEELSADHKPTDAVLNAIFLHYKCGLSLDEAKQVLNSPK